MNVQECIHCGEVKPVSEFRMRKRPPIKPYRACKPCEPYAYTLNNRTQKPNPTYRDEINEMRRKAVQLRRFNPEQDIDIYRRVMAGETRKAIAAEFGASQNAVGKAFNRGRSSV